VGLPTPHLENVKSLNAKLSVCMQLVNPPLMGVILGLVVGLTPLGTLLFPPSTATAANFAAPTPARCLFAKTDRHQASPQSHYLQVMR
jgi:hypothetical protein